MWDVFINEECDHGGWSHTNQVSTQAFVKSQHTLIPETMESREKMTKYLFKLTVPTEI